jgi:uncharacterized protein (TIGR02145 family)
MKSMKKFTIIIFLVTVMLRVQAQDYFITFAGSGDTTEVGTVLVKNITSGDSVTLDGGDVLHLKSSLGIETQDMNQSALKIYPNPMAEMSMLTFIAPESGNVVISIVDLSGKKVLQISTVLFQGTQSFRISGIHQGIYLVKVRGNNYSCSTKLVSKSDLQSDPRIESVSSVKNPLESLWKSFKTTVIMKYTTGDLLLYKGTSGQYGTLVTDAPTASMTVIFYFALCKDKDGNKYSIVKIGDQTWMAENLNTTHYGNGDFLINPTDTSLWANMAEGAYCDYGNIPANSATYGKLYNFYAVADPRNICPYGWHAPSDAEWTILTSFSGSTAGGKLKETGVAHWQSPNTGATDESGFTALPGGYRWGDGTFYNLNIMACFWSATEETSLTAWSRILSYNYDYVTREEDHKTHGYSVRCVKN